MAEERSNCMDVRYFLQYNSIFHPFHIGKHTCYYRVQKIECMCKVIKYLLPLLLKVALSELLMNIGVDDILVGDCCGVVLKSMFSSFSVRRQKLNEENY